MASRNARRLGLAAVTALAVTLAGCPNRALLDAVMRLDEEATRVDAAVMTVSVDGVAVDTGTTHDLAEVSRYSYREVVFTIQNTGNIDLMLTGSPDKVVVSGNNAADVAVTVQPTSPVGPDESTTVTVLFTPGDVGQRSAALSMANTDADRNPYTITVSYTCVPFAPPSDFSATGIASTKIRLTWTDNSDIETGFAIERSSDGTTGWTEVGQAAADATSWDDTDLDPKTTYYYKVRAFNAAGSSAYTQVAAGETLDFLAPSELTATVKSPTEIGLEWTDNSDIETGFGVERKTGTGDWEQVAQVDAQPGMGTKVTWNDTGLDPDTTYYYQVRAIDADVGGRFSPYSSIASATTGEFTAPSDLEANASSETQIQLTWTDNSDIETGFEIERSPNGTGGWTQVHVADAQTGTGTPATWNDTDLAPGTTYYYQVRAVATGEGWNSNYTDVANATTDPFGDPDNLVAATQSSTSIRLTWTDNSNIETGYRVERSPDGTTGWTEVDQDLVGANVTSWDNTSLTPDTTYYYRVRGYYSTYYSGYTFAASATTFRLPPTAATDLAADDLPLRLVHLTWTDNATNETGYKIQRSPTGADMWADVGTAAADATTWDDTPTANGTYDYRVTATNNGGDAPSDPVTVTAATVPMRSISAEDDTFVVGDGTTGPDVDQTITYDYSISKYEITNAQFQEFVDDDGYDTEDYWTPNGWTANTWTQPDGWGNTSFDDDDQPVVGVSWYEAVAYCNWLSEQEGLTPAYELAGPSPVPGTIIDDADGYRLPTEVEWEYAAAVGSSTETERDYAWGSTWDSSLAVCKVSPASASATADVGSKSTGGDTPQGLVDMTGNAKEWCSDTFLANASYPDPSPDDRYYFTDDSSSTTFVVRGGGYSESNQNVLRCSYRTSATATTRTYGQGFRVVRGVRP